MPGRDWPLTLTDAEPIARVFLMPATVTVPDPLATCVVASYKGGAGKTAVAVPIAERLALAGLRVLLMTTDTRTSGGVSSTGAKK